MQDRHACGDARHVDASLAQAQSKGLDNSLGSTNLRPSVKSQKTIAALSRAGLTGASLTMTGPAACRVPPTLQLSTPCRFL
jgi:hypothetical protein